VGEGGGEGGDNNGGKIVLLKQKIHRAFGRVDLIWVKVLSEEERDFVSC
jgi:hypothetical protein